MSRRYTYTRTIDTAQGKESFTAVEFDSFDEAIKSVEKGIYDRRLELGVKEKVVTEEGAVKFNELTPPVAEEKTTNTSRPLPKK